MAPFYRAPKTGVTASAPDQGVHAVSGTLGAPTLVKRDGGGVSHLLGQGFRCGRTRRHLGPGPSETGQIDAIGVDEIQYAKGHKNLTLVYQIDPDTTRLLWVGKERTIESFQGFFTANDFF
jgi:hypothetical protein